MSKQRWLKVTGLNVEQEKITDENGQAFDLKYVSEVGLLVCDRCATVMTDMGTDEYCVECGLKMKSVVFVRGAEAGASMRGFIERWIKKGFDVLGATLAEDLAEELGAEMPAGSLAFELTAGQMALQVAWRKHCEERAGGSDEVRIEL